MINRRLKNDYFHLIPSVEKSLAGLAPSIDEAYEIIRVEPDNEKSKRITDCYSDLVDAVGASSERSITRKIASCITGTPIR